jgi:flavin reductase (DIM6/NTAB) family NADH-FMN oxidoreductase RutF
MSSAWWLGWRCILGLDASSKSPANMLRTGECVLNLPSVEEVDAVNRLARLTGADPVPDRKVMRGYRHEAKKFETAGLTPIPSETVAAPRAKAWATTAPGRAGSACSRSGSSACTCGRTC